MRANAASNILAPVENVTHVVIGIKSQTATTAAAIFNINLEDSSDKMA